MLSRVKAMREAGSANLRRIYTYLVEINKKYSIPSACLVFTLVGVPMGIMFRSGGLAISGGVSIFFFLLYWICLIGGEDLADRGHITPWLAMWFPNFIIMALGLFLIIRNIRGYALLDLNVLMRILPKKWRGLANN
jgi:lipopolysaccharide export system permease protein